MTTQGTARKRENTTLLPTHSDLTQSIKSIKALILLMHTLNLCQQTFNKTSLQ